MRPVGGVVLDSSGNLFGTTLLGGPSLNGTVFELARGTSNVTTLVTFTQSNGQAPYGDLIFDSKGNLYGTTQSGGTANAGTVFQLSPIPPSLSFTNPPAPTVAAGAALGGAAGIAVGVFYALGNLATDDASTVTLTLGGGVFSSGSNTATASVVNGVAAFSNLSINAPGRYILTASDGSDAAATASFVVGASPALSATQVGDGSTQRSSVRSLGLTFSQGVSLGGGAFTLYQEAVNADGSLNTAAPATDVTSAITASSTDSVNWTLSVNAGGTLDRTAGATNAGLFADGIFQLVLHGSKITDAATGTFQFNSGGDQIVAFASPQVGGPSSYFHVLFGDINGDGSVNLSDYRLFKLDFLADSGDSNYSAAFDYDGDGSINLNDYRKFKGNYLASFSYAAQTHSISVKSGTVPGNRKHQ